VNEALIRQYLLGNMAEAQKLELEERFVCDPNVLEMVEIIENDLIEEYLDKELSDKDRQRFETYFLAAPQRREQLKIEKALREKRPPRILSNPYFMMAAAAVILIGFGLGIWYLIGKPRNSDLQTGMDALKKAYPRPLEARLADFPYSPPPRSTRGKDQNKADTIEDDAAKTLLQHATQTEPNAKSFQAYGQFWLAKKDFNQAIENLKKALSYEPSNGQILSDLGTAYFEKGRDEKDQGLASASNDFDQSLQYLNKAVDSKPASLEALFNRALLYEQMGNTQKAEEDWQEYIKRDPNSPWTDDAMRKLNDLKEKRS